MKTTLNQLKKSRIKNSKYHLIAIVIGVIVLIICRFILHIKHLHPLLSAIMSLIVFFLISGFVINIIDLFKIKELKRDNNLKIEFEKEVVYYPYCCLLTDRYFMIEFNKKLTIDYMDIVLVYIKDEWYNKGMLYILIILRTGKKYKTSIDRAFLREYNLSTDDILNFVMNKNNNILIGETKENKRILLEKYNIKI